MSPIPYKYEPPMAVIKTPCSGVSYINGNGYRMLVENSSPELVAFVQMLCGPVDKSNIDSYLDLALKIINR